MSGERPERLVCLVEDVPVGEGRAALVDGVRIAVFHRPDGSWAGLDAVCTHRGGPLQDGILADASVTCPLHNNRFDLDTGQAIGHDCPAVRAHEVVVRDGRVHVRLGADAADAAAGEPVLAP